MLLGDFNIVLPISEVFGHVTPTVYFFDRLLLTMSLFASSVGIFVFVGLVLIIILGGPGIAIARNWKYIS